MVVRGVKLFQNNTYVEYSDLEIMQMIGRAVCAHPYFISIYLTIRQGRPQFGTLLLVVLGQATHILPQTKMALR